MVKILSRILVLFLLLSSNTYADKSHLRDFNDFLEANKKKLAEYGIDGIEVVNVCKVHKKNSNKWLEAECQDRPGGTFEVKHKLKIKFFKGYIKSDTKKVNKDTLLYYGHYQLYEDTFLSQYKCQEIKKTI